MPRQAEARILVEQELRVRDAAIREFAAHVERMREEDRKYIAREIHDELGQLLAALHLEISLLKSVEDNRKRVEIIRRNMSELVDKADQSVRNVAEHLRPASLGLGIISAIKKLIDEFRKHSGASCVLHLMEASIDLDEDQTVAIFRIVQESLTNVTRHAKASRVDITLSQNADDVIVEVRDDGKGFDSADAARKKSFGCLECGSGRPYWGAISISPACRDKEPWLACVYQSNETKEFHDRSDAGANLAQTGLLLA
jgi:signal transduction histidine kinase